MFGIVCYIAVNNQKNLILKEGDTIILTKRAVGLASGYGRRIGRALRKLLVSNNKDYIT